MVNRWSSRRASAAASRETPTPPAQPVQDGDEPTTVRGGDEHTMFQGGGDEEAMNADHFNANEEENGPDQQAPDEHRRGQEGWGPGRLPLPPDVRPNGRPALYCLDCLEQELIETIAELEPRIRDNDYLASEMLDELCRFRWMVHETKKWVPRGQ